ncbi:MAG: hypothetical protein J7L08_00440 [Candidatus Aenigmarchaeota archaeon]|nr:hypothetical protein [Candidatus Aenigmarchaeota archaeon]
MNAKPLFFWLTGSLLVLFGAMIAGQARPDVLGASTSSFIISIVVAFILILVGSLMWITVSGIINKY